MPLLYKTDQIAVWRLNESSDELYQQFKHPELLDDGLHAISSEMRRAEWLAVRHALRELLGREYAVSYRSTGAPYIADLTDDTTAPQRHISITHTKGYVAAMVADTRHGAGIDIEYRSERVLRVASRFLHPTREQVEDQNDNDRLTRTLLCWSAKESVFKAWGATNVEFADQIIVRPFTLTLPYGTMTVEATLEGQTDRFTLHYEVTNAYVLTHIIP